MTEFQRPKEPDFVSIQPQKPPVNTIDNGNKVIDTSTSDGNKNWQYSQQDFTSSVCHDPLNNQVISCSLKTKNVVAVDANNANQNWKHSLHSSDLNSVAIDTSNNQVISAARSNVIAVDAQDGTQNWTFFTNFEMGRDVDYDPVNNQVLAASGQKIKAVDADNGSQNWQHSLHSGRARGVVFDPLNNQVISCSGDQRVIAVDAQDGTQNWVNSNHTNQIFDVSFDTTNNQTISGASEPDSTVRTFDGVTGVQNWKHSLHSDDDVRAVNFDPVNRQVLSGSLNGIVKSVSPQDGSENWSYSDTANDLTDIGYDSVNNQLLYVSNTSNNVVRAINIKLLGKIFVKRNNEYIEIQ